MKVEHIALYIQDLEGARTFFRDFFGAVSGPEYYNTQTGFRSYFLTFDGGSRLELMTRPGVQAVSGAQFPAGYAHLAFSAGSREAVDQLTDRLVRSGYQALSGPRITGDGYYESCILGFEGNQIEITV